MDPGSVSAFSTITAGIVMLYLGTRKRMLDLRMTHTRCLSCGKLYRRGDACSCWRR